MFKNTKLVGLFSLTVCFFSAGIVAPALSQSQEYPTQTAVDGNVTWEMKSCARKLKTVECTFSLNTSQDLGYGIRVAPTKMVNVEGDEYTASLVKSGIRQSGAGGNDGIHIDMAKNAHYNIIIDFSEVPTSVSQITLLKICVNDCFGQVKFRDIPIINPDGSFTVIPSSERSPVNRQPSNTNNPTPKRKVCLPVVGCL